MTPEFYQGNRRTVAQAAADVFIFTAHDAMQLKVDQSIFVQNAHFLYLTGIDETGWQLVIEKSPYTETLIAPERDETQVLFEGGLTAEDAMRISGVSKILSQKEGGALLKELAIESNAAAYLGPEPYEAHNHSTTNPSRARLENKIKKLFKETVDVRPDLARQRAIKQPEEIALLRRAVGTTAEGFRAIERMIREGARFEYELEAELSRAFRSTGAHRHAYEPIVASGSNACVLHYAKNEAPLTSGDLVLIDAGAQVHGYAADVTRTYAVGEVSARHQAVHAAVVVAHEAIIAFIQPGRTFKEYQAFTDATMKRALEGLELLKNESDYRRYFPHAISHGLGLDVHESLGSFAEFMPGMVLTVEPGIYIAEEGIGVRIEDDILVTETGVEVLSGELPTSLCYNSK